MGVEPSRSLEIERKYDVDDDTPLPDWTGLPGIAGVGAPELRELDARYLDTDDLALALAGVAVRRRTGGPDAGWHIKVAAPEGRHEYHWDLGDDDGSIPDAVARALTQWTVAAVRPVARIRNTRTAYALHDQGGALVAEVVDDRVTATALRSGAVTAWREWEFELGPAAPSSTDDRAALFAAVDDLVRGGGGRVSASDSKLARALAAERT